MSSFEAIFSHATPCREGVLSGNQAGCRLFETQKIQVENLTFSWQLQLSD
jgi:hypothetical protein